MSKTIQLIGIILTLVSFLIWLAQLRMDVYRAPAFVAMLIGLLIFAAGRIAKA